MTTDGLTMFFSSDDLPGGKGEDMWMASRNSQDERFGNVIHLGPEVNSPMSDDVGSISADGLTLYFGSNRTGNWDIYTTTRTSVNDQFGNVQLLGGPVNTDVLENSPRISPDGLTMTYYSSAPPTDTDVDIWMATRDSVEEEFSNATRLAMNRDDVDDWWPSLSSYGLVLVVSDQPGQPLRPGGEGGEDIWVAVRDSLDEPFPVPAHPDDVWPGSQVNSAVRAAYPFLSQDWPELGSKLYFAATGPGAVSGTADIFQMTWMIPEDGDINLDGWEDPTDLNDMCTQIRSTAPDMIYDLDADGSVTLAEQEILLARLEILPGDIDFNGTVEFADFLLFSDVFGRTSGRRHWDRGDFDCSGMADFADFLALSANFGKSFESPVAVVPEPSTYMLLVVTCLSLVIIRFGI